MGRWLAGLVAALTVVGVTGAPGGEAAVATFAGGCFWCMEHPFDVLPGVLETTPGYTGGRMEYPTYEQVSAGGTGHAEAVQITYDPGRITYRALLDVFWHNIDPTTPNRQFSDVGSQYRTAIFYHGDAQRLAAEKSRDEWAASGVFGAPIVTEIVEAGSFYPAEAYHQDYYRTNPIRYRMYRWGSGRDRYLDRLWGRGVEETVHERRE